MRRLTRSIVLVGLVGLACLANSAAARPPHGPYEPFRVKTDNVPQAEIDGWILPAAGRPQGTMFLLHGWNNGKDWVVGWEWVRDRLDWNVVMFDFREHGASTRTRHLSSLGYHEVWDVKAVVDHAERKGLARPYVIYGRSLGAAVGLRWASMDPRITGVVAVSPFKNAYLASQQFAAVKLPFSRVPSPFLAHPGFKQMLREVDIPTAVAARDDLRVWILVGEDDCFPPADGHEILAASRSPASLKRLVVADNCDHRNVWLWKGAPGRPGHDAYLTEFLAASGRDGPLAPARLGVWLLTAAAGVGIAGLLTFLRRSRYTRRQTDSPPELLPTAST